MTKFLQTLVDGIAVGSLYALIALGYTMVYGILKFINFAHGDVFMLGAWISFWIAQKAGWLVQASYQRGLIVLLMAMLACTLLGFVIERCAYRPLRKAPRLNVLITAIGVSLLLENLGQLDLFFGAQPQRMPSLLPDQILLEIAGVPIRLVDISILVVALLLMLFLEWLIFRSKIGRAMRAVSYDLHVASLMGVNVDRLISVTFMIGSSLAAAAGFLYAIKYPGLNQPAHSSWILLGLKAFVAAVVGGIGNIQGAVLGGLLIGMIELFGAAYLSPHLRDVYVFSILIGVLLFRPTGILGRTAVEKV